MTEPDATFDNAKNQIVIKASTRFDFSSHREFRAAYMGCPANASYVVDLSETDYIDSSALGMLLLLREHAGGDDADVTLLGCHNEVHKVLTISNFQNLFRIIT